MALAAAKLLRADTNPATIQSNEMGQATTIERVLIPVDAEKHPIGSKYFLSERFLQKLLNPPSGENGVEHRWLLRDASYAGELTETHGKSEVVAGTWSLAFSIETMARSTTIELPLVQDEAVWQSAAMLDGVPVPISWSADGNQCAIDVAEPGRYTLTIFGVPKTKNINGSGQFSLSVPPLISANIQLHAPEQLKGITIANSTVLPTTKDVPGILEGELTKAARIAVHWPRVEQKDSSQDLNVIELNWLHVGTSGTELETKYVIGGGGRRPDSLTINYDRRWVPIVNTGRPTTDTTTSNDGHFRYLHIPLPPDNNGRQEIAVRWRLIDAPDAGFVRLPPISLANLSITHRWFALSADSMLDCAFVDNNTSAATGKEFLAQWGASDDASPPQAVFANFDADRLWTLAIRPRESESVVREVLHVAAGLRTARVVYQANVTPGNNDRFQFRLNVPANFTIDGIDLAEADRQIPTRWTRDAENHVNIFFGDAARSDFRLTLSGAVPVDANSSFGLPHVSAIPSRSATQQVQLYRDDDVEVNLQHGFSSAADTDAGPAELPPIQWQVRPIGTYHLNESALRTARLSVKPSQVEIRGDTFTAIYSEESTWWATFHARISARRGTLDILRLRVPTACAGPFEVESSVPVTTDLLSLDEHHQTLAVRFTSAVDESSDVDLHIRSPLTIPSGSAVSVPNITSLELSQGRRYIGVPAALDNQPLNWSDTGVRPAQAPKSLLKGVSNAAELTQFEVVQDPVHVAIQSQATKLPTPRIRLADINVSASRSGGQVLVSRFVIAPEGLNHCTLQQPSDQQLLSVELDGQPALTTAQGSQWRIAPERAAIATNAGSCFMGLRQRSAKSSSQAATPSPFRR